MKKESQISSRYVDILRKKLNFIICLSSHGDLGMLMLKSYLTDHHFQIKFGSFVLKIEQIIAGVSQTSKFNSILYLNGIQNGGLNLIQIKQSIQYSLYITPSVLVSLFIIFLSRCLT